MKRALVCGAGGFIGGHLVKRLKTEGYHVTGADIKQHEFSKLPTDQFHLGDLCDMALVEKIFQKGFDEVYQLAADMGGAGYIFTGDHDANLMTNSASVNINVLRMCARGNVGKIFYSSSACIYPEYNQLDPNHPVCTEKSAYPAAPDSEYGWEKLFSERLYLAYARNYKLNVCIARFHNIFGPEGVWRGGKEKAPAALCRKVAEASLGGTVEIWGDGKQTRTFLYIDECIEGVRRLMKSSVTEPLNIGSEELISLNDLARLLMQISGKDLLVQNVSGPNGVRGRKSDNALIREKLKWSPSQPLRTGLEKTYAWVLGQVQAATHTSKKIAA